MNPTLPVVADPLAMLMAPGPSGSTEGASDPALAELFAALVAALLGASTSADRQVGDRATASGTGVGADGQSATVVPDTDVSAIAAPMATAAAGGPADLVVPPLPPVPAAPPIGADAAAPLVSAAGTEPDPVPLATDAVSGEPAAVGSETARQAGPESGPPGASRSHPDAPPPPAGFELPANARALEALATRAAPAAQAHAVPARALTPTEAPEGEAADAPSAPAPPIGSADAPDATDAREGTPVEGRAQGREHRPAVPSSIAAPGRGTTQDPLPPATGSEGPTPVAAPATPGTDPSLPGVTPPASPTPPPAPAAPAPAGPAPQAAPPAPPPAPVHEQVVAAVSPLRQGADGSHRLTLQLHPEELGRVLLDVHVRDGHIAVHVLADEDAGRALLRDALPALRSELHAAGFDSASVDVGGSGRGAPDREANPDAARPDGSGLGDESPAAPRAPRTAGAPRVDGDRPALDILV